MTGAQLYGTMLHDPSIFEHSGGEGPVCLDSPNEISEDGSDAGAKYAHCEIGCPKRAIYGSASDSSPRSRRSHQPRPSPNRRLRSGWVAGSYPAATVATLYVVGVPAGEPDDITLRALRVLGEVSCVVADDVAQAQRFLDHYKLNTRLAGLGDVDALAAMLESGDLALLAEGWLLGPSLPSLALIRLAMQGGHSVVPVPGPSFPITALVVSGLPADSFVYLGELPRQPQVRDTLLSSARHERRSLVLLETPEHLHDQLTGLFEFMENRKLVVAAASDQGAQVVWQGTIRDALEHLPPCPSVGPLVLVIGGAKGQGVRWDEQRLHGEVQARLEQGLGAKEVSRQLAGESGWPRREVYRLAVEASRFHQSE